MFTLWTRKPPLFLRLPRFLPLFLRLPRFLPLAVRVPDAVYSAVLPLEVFSPFLFVGVTCTTTLTGCFPRALRCFFAAASWFGVRPRFLPFFLPLPFFPAIFAVPFLFGGAEGFTKRARVLWPIGAGFGALPSEI